MKTPSPIDISSKTFTRRQTLGLFAVGVIGTAATSVHAKASNDHQSSQHADNTLVTTLQSQDIPKPIVISF